jgi:Flp pilus assembly protein TadG
MAENTEKRPAMKRFIGRISDLASSFWSDTSGIMLPYVTMILAFMVGLALLAVDGARYVSLQTQMQAAADALALAGARELNQRSGAQARAIAAMADTAIGNNNTLFGLGSSPTFTYTYTFYQSLDAASTGDSGTAPGGSQEQMDLATKYVKVAVSPVAVNTMFPFTANVAATFSGEAEAVAGFTATTVCQVAAVFMCNPYETSGMTDAQATQALVQALDPNDPNYSAATVRKQFRLNRTGIAPGNFGWVQTVDCPNSGANCMRNDLASAGGACYTSFTVTLATGNKNQVEQYLDTRFDIYSQNPAPTISSTNAPSINVRKGYSPGTNQNWSGAACSANPEYASAAYYTTPITTTTGTTSSGTNSITSVGSTTNIDTGEYVAGQGIPYGTKVSSVSGSTVNITVPGGGGTTASGTNVGLTFYFPTPTGSGGINLGFNATSGSSTLTIFPSLTTQGDTKNNQTQLKNVVNSDTIGICNGSTVTGGNIPANTTVSGSPPYGGTVPISNAATGNTNHGETLTFSPCITVSVGQFVGGTGIPADTTVTSVGGNSITISNNATQTIPNDSLVFFWLESPLLKDKQWTGVCSGGTCSQGNGDWDCLLYWRANHSSAAAPTGCTSSNPTISRYQVYRYEIANSLINDWSGNHAANTSGNTGNGENGAPYCAATGIDTTTGGADRRNTIVPIINCLAQAGNIGSGSNSQVPAAAFGKFFMTQPWSAESTYLYGEMTGLVGSGDHVTILNQVQLYR